jgi:hypothetical protein
VADLLVIVPSRGRPENIRRLLQAYDTTKAYAPLLVAVDDDDPMLDEYCSLQRSSEDGDVFPFALQIGPRRSLSGWTNDIAVDRAPAYTALASMGDDHVPRTLHWDQRVIDTLHELGTGLCYGDDLHQGARLPTACFVTSDIVAALGYMSPPEMSHFYCDDFWRDFGNDLARLRYLPDVVIEHLHPAAGKAPTDALYDECGAGMEADLIAYRAYQASRFPADVAKVRALCAS